MGVPGNREDAADHNNAEHLNNGVEKKIMVKGGQIQPEQDKKAAKKRQIPVFIYHYQATKRKKATNTSIYDTMYRALIIMRIHLPAILVIIPRVRYCDLLSPL